MIGSVVYGLVLAAAFLLFCRAAPQPAGAILFWVAVAIHFVFIAGVTWSRTRLPLATAAMTFGAVASALLAVSAVRGQAFPQLPLEWAMPVYALAVAAPLCLLIESRVHPREWDRWRAHMERMNALDIVRGRHIPAMKSLSTGPREGRR
jgi:hypothetical protein